MSKLGRLGKFLIDPLVDVPELPGGRLGKILERSIEELSAPASIASILAAPLTGGASLGARGALAGRFAPALARSAGINIGGALGANTALEGANAANAPGSVKFAASVAGGLLGGGTGIARLRKGSNGLTKKIFGEVDESALSPASLARRRQRQSLSKMRDIDQFRKLDTVLDDLPIGELPKGGAIAADISRIREAAESSDDLVREGNEVLDRLAGLTSDPTPIFKPGKFVMGDMPGGPPNNLWMVTELAEQNDRKLASLILLDELETGAIEVSELMTKPLIVEINQALTQLEMRAVVPTRSRRLQALSELLFVADNNPSTDSVTASLQGINTLLANDLKSMLTRNIDTASLIAKKLKEATDRSREAF